MGTAFHSTVTLPGNQTTLNITTTDYPGVMYMLQLYRQEDGGQKTKVATGFARSGMYYV